MNNPFDIVGRHVLVTGASSGLGRFFAQTLAARGAIVTLAARRLDALEQVVARINEDGGTAQTVSMDVQDEQSVTDAFGTTRSLAGVPTIVVNNAGIASTQRALELPMEEYDRIMDTNLRGAWVVARQAARCMTDAGRGGSIINIASILGIGVAGSVMPYAVSKAGLIHMTRSLALEWSRHDIRVNAIAPGYFETELNAEFLASDAGQVMKKRVPMRRFGQLDELTGPLLLLASDAGSYLTGSVINADGGHLVSSL